MGGITTLFRELHITYDEEGIPREFVWKCKDEGSDVIEQKYKVMHIKSSYLVKML